MLRAHGSPDDLDPETTAQITRTFLVVRIVRGSLLLVFLLVAVGAILARHWPTAIAAAVALAAALQAARLASNIRRYRLSRPTGTR